MSVLQNLQISTGASPRTLSVTISAGSTIVVFGTRGDASGATITASDPTNGTYTALGPQQNDGSTNTSIQSFYFQNAASGTYTISLTSAGSNGIGGWFYECSGQNIAPTGNSAVYLSGASGTDALTSGNVTISGSATLLGYAAEFSGTTAVPAVGTGFSSDGSSTDGTIGSQRVEHKSASSTAAATFTAGVSTEAAAAFGVAVLEPVTGPTINTQPTNQSVFSGQTATFSVSATTSGGALSYQWKYSHDDSAFANCTHGSGITTSSFTTATTPDSEASDQYSFLCAVTDSNGTTNTNAALLNMTTVASLGWLKT